MRLWDDAKALRRVTLWLYSAVIVSVCVAGFKWLWETPYFPIQHIYFYGQLHEADAVKLAGVAQKNISGNFFKADMNRLKQALGQNPWVESVRVQRLWPDTVNVYLVERKAQARYAEGGLVDDKGRRFQAQTKQVLPEYAAEAHMLPKLVAFHNKTLPMLAPYRLSIRQLNVSERGAWTLVLDNGVKLQLGRRDLEVRLQRFLTYWQRDLQPLGSSLEYVDLRYHDGFAVKRQAADANPQPDTAENELD